jgi:hypothetical protein
MVFGTANEMLVTDRDALHKYIPLIGDIPDPFDIRTFARARTLDMNGSRNLDIAHQKPPILKGEVYITATITAIAIRGIKLSRGLGNWASLRVSCFPLNRSLIHYSSCNSDRIVDNSAKLVIGDSGIAQPLDIRGSLLIKRGLSHLRANEAVGVLLARLAA